MGAEPYRSARRVFWVLDNGSSHRGAACERRLRQRWRNVRVVHTPVHASWLNQIEIYFSIVQRKVLTPNQFVELAAVEASLIGFQDHYASVARPFEWRFTRKDLFNVLTGLKPLDLAA
jgi:hypothetical protein